MPHHPDSSDSAACQGPARPATVTPVATCTAHITVGAPTTGWGGEGVGVGPSHIIYLVEGGRAAWCMEPVTHTGDPQAGAGDAVTWVARAPELILADGLMMIAALIQSDEKVRGLLGTSRAKRTGGGRLLELDWADLGDLEDEVIASAESASVGALATKLVVTVMEGSSIRGQLGLLERGSMDVEVCTPSWLRALDDRGEVHAAGNLPPEDPGDHRFTAIRL